MGSEDPGATAAYDYELPTDLIAARPAERRDASRLLRLDRARGTLADLRFADVVGLVRSGDALVLNDSRVFPARLVGAKPTGAAAEILLVRPVDGFDAERPELWEAIVRPGAKLKPGRRVVIAGGVGDEAALEVAILESREDGSRIVRLEGAADPWSLIERHGHVPLPPYIDRPDEPADRERYQTVYARAVGSVAAPTAGLHFTDELLEAIVARGARIVRTTLHVGIGTFRPVATERVDDHRLHAEVFRLDAEAAAALNEARAGGGRVWAVGTTSCRVLETASDREGRFRPAEGSTELFIRPPYRFCGVDALLTNFHLPRSSLLMLVAAFAGREAVLQAYRHAIDAEYRFYSYGDAMVIT